MSRTTTTAIRTILASALVASGIGAQTLGAAGATTQEVEAPPTTTSAPARQESHTHQESTERSEIDEVELLVTETTIHTENQDQHEMVIWALGRYEQAGLELPPIEIHIHTDRSECGGLNGSLSDQGGRGYLIHSCGNEYTLLHELAHAWDLHNPDEAARNELLEIAQASTWPACSR